MGTCCKSDNVEVARTVSWAYCISDSCEGAEMKEKICSRQVSNLEACIPTGLFEWLLEQDYDLRALIFSSEW